jgi:hypothetical protein
MNTAPLHQMQRNGVVHTHFIAAVLSSFSAGKVNQSVSEVRNWQIPVIELKTDSDTRLSMTLNGMRMATEFFAHDSPRILALVEHRLKARQRDVVHDILVYLWEQVLLMRANAQEAKDLQAQSLAAYLGLELPRVQMLFTESPLLAARITQRIREGEAGIVQRHLDLDSLTENLLARLQDELNEWKKNEQRILFLIEEIVSRLYADRASNDI